MAEERDIRLNIKANVEDAKRKTKELEDQIRKSTESISKLGVPVRDVPRTLRDVSRQRALSVRSLQEEQTQRLFDLGEQRREEMEKAKDAKKRKETAEEFRKKFLAARLEHMGRSQEVFKHYSVQAESFRRHKEEAKIAEKAQKDLDRFDNEEARIKKERIQKQRSVASAGRRGAVEGRRIGREGDPISTGGEVWDWRTHGRAKRWGALGTEERAFNVARIEEQRKALNRRAFGFEETRGVQGAMNFAGKGAGFLKAVVGTVVTSAAVSTVLRDTSFAVSRMVRARNEFEMLPAYYRLQGSLYGMGMGATLGGAAGAVSGIAKAGPAIIAAGGAGLATGGPVGMLAAGGATLLGAGAMGATTGGVMGASIGSAAFGTMGEIYGEAAERMLTTRSAYHKAGARAAWLAGRQYGGAYEGYIGIGRSGAQIAEADIAHSRAAGVGFGINVPMGGEVGGVYQRREGEKTVREFAGWRRFNYSPGTGGTEPSMTFSKNLISDKDFKDLIKKEEERLITSHGTHGTWARREYLRQNLTNHPYSYYAPTYRDKIVPATVTDVRERTRLEEADKFRHEAEKLYGKSFMNKILAAGARTFDISGMRGGRAVDMANLVLQDDFAFGRRMMHRQGIEDKGITAARMQEAAMTSVNLRATMSANYGTGGMGLMTGASRDVVSRFVASNMGSKAADREAMAAYNMFMSPSTDMEMALKTSSLMAMGTTGGIYDFWKASRDPTKIGESLKMQRSLALGLFGEDLGKAYLGATLIGKGGTDLQARAYAEGTLSTEEYRAITDKERKDELGLTQKGAKDATADIEKSEAKFAELAAGAKTVTEYLSSMGKILGKVEDQGVVANLNDFNDLLNKITKEVTPDLAEALRALAHATGVATGSLFQKSLGGSHTVTINTVNADQTEHQ